MSASPPSEQPFASRWARVQSLRARHARAEHLAFFAAGFTFDALMVTRIDDWPVLAQQGAYLAVTGLLLQGLGTWDHRGQSPPLWLQRGWTWATPLLHFMLGTLLNAYALFYVKSATGLTAVAVGLVIAALLVVNELPRFRRAGPIVMYGLYSTCLTSYFAYLYPVLLGRLRAWMFLAAVGTSLVPLAALLQSHVRRPGDRRRVLRQMLAPALGAQVVLLGLFTLDLIPPVPVSLRHIGIYHAVTRAAEGYQVSYQPGPWWAFWSHDDVAFVARPGDRVYCFARIFAPRNFRDDVRVRWSWYDPSRGWVPSDAVAMTIAGGREDGYGGYAYKQHYQPGEWRVAVETADGREVGSRRFTISADPAPAEPRTLQVVTR